MNAKVTDTADQAWAVTAVPVAGCPILRPTALVHGMAGRPAMETQVGSKSLGLLAVKARTVSLPY